MTIDEYITKTTPRLHRGYVAWLNGDWDRPSRTDWYIMQATLEVLRSNQRVKNPNGLKIRDMLLPFSKNSRNRSGDDEEGLTDEERLERSKGFWVRQGKSPSSGDPVRVSVKQVPQDEAMKELDDILARHPMFCEKDEPPPGELIDGHGDEE